jgi:hypothetical protein
MARIKMTPMVRIALWALRIYLLVLLSLIALKFIRGFGERKLEAESAKVVTGAVTNQPSGR